MRVFNNVEHGGLTNTTLLFTPESKRNVGRSLKTKFDENQTWFNDMQCGGETSATGWVQQCWSMLHQHVASGWPPLKIQPLEQATLVSGREQNK